MTETGEAAETVEMDEDAAAGGEAEPLEVADAAEAVEAPDGPTRLEEDGEIAADYLEELLDIADIDGDIDIDVEHGRAVVAVVSDDPLNRDLQALIGPDGEVLDAIQELTRLAVQARTGERSRLMVDIAGHRQRRRDEVRAIALEAIKEAQVKGVSVALEPMNAFERKAVHDAVAEAGLVSQSSGVDPDRHVEIRPA
ncbi:MAG: single-stranded DNA-binding protein [Bifidobacteriaceae bacterium]|nr:single-stranded DNA-binding protein [Bifidobacteriaceae bacterium]